MTSGMDFSWHIFTLLIHHDHTGPSLGKSVYLFNKDYKTMPIGPLKGSYGHLEGGWIGATPNFNSFSILGLA